MAASDYKISLRKDQVQHLLTILVHVKELHRARLVGGDVDRLAHQVAHAYISDLAETILMQCGDVK